MPGEAASKRRMPLLNQMRSLLCGDEETIYECRVCGTTTPSGADHCCECGSTEIAAFEI